MVELDRNLGVISELVNKWYSHLFPDLLATPEFTISRAMVTIWKTKVFNKIEATLFESFRGTLIKARHEQIKKGKGIGDYDEDKNTILLNRFIQSIGDLSINEIKVHMLGNTKFIPDDPYEQLETIIISETR